MVMRAPVLARLIHFLDRTKALSHNCNEQILIIAGPRMSHMPYNLSALSLSKRGYLFLFGLYPKASCLPFFKLLLPRSKYLKLTARIQPDAYDDRIVNIVLSELFSYCMSLCYKAKLPLSYPNFFAWLSSILFSLDARQRIKNGKFKILHYRSGYGNIALQAARSHGVVCLCDHTIAHPSLNHFLCTNHGQYPANSSQVSAEDSGQILLPMMLEDIQNADRILVNSDFVKDTLLFMGVPIEKIVSIFLPVEPQFQAEASRLLSTQKKRPAYDLLFAGSFTERKGISLLLRAFSRLDTRFSLRLAGVTASQLQSWSDVACISVDRVLPLGYLPRQKLIEEMVSSSIFVYPSLCEGYAKVVQEAMACGCFIVATKNSGFSCSRGESGVVVEPVIESLVDAINQAVSLPNLISLGLSNEKFAIDHFSISSYRSNLFSVYDQLLGSYT